MQRCLPFDEFWEMVACLGEAGLKSLSTTLAVMFGPQKLARPRELLTKIVLLGTS